MKKAEILTPKDVKAKTKAFISDRKNANNLVVVMTGLEGDNEELIISCIRSFNTIFSLLISQQEMFFMKPPSHDDDDNLDDLNAEEKYKIWLHERYGETKSRLLQLLTHENNHIQELSLCTLVKFVEAESRTPLVKISDKHLTFPVVFFEDIVRGLLSSSVDMTAVVRRFQEYLEYDDVRYFTMKHSFKDLTHRVTQENADMTNIYKTNLHFLLENLSMPKPEDEETLSKFVSRLPDSSSTVNFKVKSFKEHKKLFTKLWLEYLKLKLPTSIYKKVLVGLSDKVFPHMTSPLLLADFLTASYNIGGAISLLALNGLFILVHSFNLDYPDFFKKLYSLFEPSIFHVKYRARFFFLSDLFLTSTHLPAYLVAAFIKRLSRLLLTAPPYGVNLSLPFIYNLIRRHPECKVLIHRPDAPQDLSNDPFSMEEPDPANCRALESSLWEIRTLQDHYHHSVSTEARKINWPVSGLESDISELLELSIDDMFKKEMKKKIRKVAVTYETPRGLFGNKDDRLSEIWELD